MKLHNVSGLRENLGQLQTEQLQNMLQSELEREKPDQDSVRLILDVLEGRGTEPAPQSAAQKEAAWQKYQEKIARLRRKPSRHWNTLAKAASLVLIIGVLVTTIPGQAQAKTFWEMLQEWSVSVVEYFSPKDEFVKYEYAFVTDNDGLQRVYDAVAELGVTEPVVPMWLPDNYMLVEIQKKNTPMANAVWAWFDYDNNEIVFRLSLYNGEPAHQFYKGDTHAETYEREGATYNITRNNDRWVVVWTIENIECLLTLDCNEDTLQRILKSIYVMEDS